MLDAVAAGRLTLVEAARLISTNGAERFGLARKGVVAPGADADLTIVDLNATTTIDASKLLSAARETDKLHDGLTFRGRVAATVLAGASSSTASTSSTAPATGPSSAPTEAPRAAAATDRRGGLRRGERRRARRRAAAPRWWRSTWPTRTRTSSLASATDADRVRWRRGDVTDRAAMDALVAEVAPDAIVHGAALTPGDDEERADPARVIDVNAGRHAGLARGGAPCRRRHVRVPQQHRALRRAAPRARRARGRAGAADGRLRDREARREQLVARHAASPASAGGWRGSRPRTDRSSGRRNRARARRRCSAPWPRRSRGAPCASPAPTWRATSCTSTTWPRPCGAWRRDPGAPDGVVHVGPERAEPRPAATPRRSVGDRLAARKSAARRRAGIQNSPSSLSAAAAPSRLVSFMLA
jgi:hypothetical protein